MMNTFLDTLWTEHKYDGTKRSTINGMSFELWNMVFYHPEKGKEIKVIRGDVAHDILSIYVGGNQNCYQNSLTNGYAYDMVSMYSSCMLLELPVGDATFTTNKNIDELFGFIFGKIIPPVNAPEQHYIVVRK